MFVFWCLCVLCISCVGLCRCLCSVLVFEGVLVCVGVFVCVLVSVLF